MRKALAFALAVVVGLTGLPVGAVAAAVISPGFSPLLAGHVVPDAYLPEAPEFYAEEFPQDANGIRHARRLGGRTAFNRPALVKIDTLQQMLKAPNAPADIRKVLSDAGIAEISGPRGSVADTVIGAMSSWPEAPETVTGNCDTLRPQEGVVAECDFHPGSMMKWMALRPNAPKDRTAGIVDNVRWAGPKPFRAFIFTATAGGKVYTFVVPKDCGNLALLDTTDLPPPPAPVVVPAPPPPVVTPQPPAQPAPPQQSLDCIATDSAGQALPGAIVRLRNAAGEIVATTTTDERGRCPFGFLPPGTYTLEILNQAGAVIGTSAPVTVVAGAVAAAAATVATGAVSAVGAVAVAAGAGGLAGIFGSSLVTALVIGAATVGGIFAIAAIRNDASPSR